MRTSKLFVWIFSFIFLIGLASALTSGGYTYSNPKVSGSSSSLFTSYNSNFGSTFYDTSFFDNSLCEEGQDFLIRVDTTKCSPTVVRSDLLEEEDIPVFCPVQAIKINPLIDVSSIDSISFSGDYPPMVKTVGFTPVYTALGGNRKLNNFQWDNVGYVTVILRNEPNESAMPDFVDLNLTARISYDLRGGFGLMTHNFYLPVMSDDKFNQEMGKYSFFNHMGYIRADSIDEDSATVSIYRDLYQNPMNANSNEKQRLQSFELKVGESSPKITLPGFECLSKVKFTLSKIDYADTSAEILVNSEYFSVRDEESFLGGACKVKDINNRGLYQSTRVSCTTDDGTDTFDLRVSPKVVFDIDGKKVNASLGDKIGTSKDGEDLFFAYLNKQGDKMKALVIAIPAGRQNKLSDSDLNVASYLGDNIMEDSSSLGSVINSISGTGVRILGYLKEGKSRAIISKEESATVSGSVVSLDSLGIKKNEVMTPEIEKEYKDALDDYNAVISNYIGEKYPATENITLAEDAIVGKINLAEDVMQFEDVKEFCLQLDQQFASSQVKPAVCSDDLFLSNEDVSVKKILLNGDYKRVVFNGVYEPDLKDYGALVTVKDLKNGTAWTFSMKKKTQIYLPSSTSGESFTLEKVDDKSIQISYNLNNLKTGAAANSLVSTTSTLTLNGPKSFNDQYEFTLKDTYLNKVAYVKVDPSINYDVSEASFNYKIGIEKRLIQLSPEKARSIADKVNNTIKTLDSITSGLDKVTETMKDACLATGGFLTLKNVLLSKNGETIARGEVMDEWEKTCSKLVPGQYRSLESCYLDHADEIDSEVESISQVMASQEDTFKSIVDSSNLVINEGGVFGSDVINSTGLALKFSSTVVNELNSLIELNGGDVLKSPVKTDESIDLSKVILILEDDNNVGASYSIEDLRLIDKYYTLYSKNQSSSLYYNKLYSAIEQIVVNENVYSEYLASRKVNEVSREEMKLVVAYSDKAKTGSYTGYKLKSDDEIHKLGDMSGLPIGSNIQWIELLDGKKYYVYLRPTGVDDKYRIAKVYNGSDGKDLGDAGIAKMKESFSVFELVNSGSYNYEIAGSDYKIRYYESGSFKGLPALVPFDKNHGWYAKIENSISSTTGYDDSAKVESFYLCNVMNDGLIGDGDECELITLSSSKYAAFSGLTDAEMQQLVDKAVKSVASAGQAQNKKGAIKLPNGESVPVGEPYSSSVSKTTCSDFMSPKECNLLFNLCDPVICPESRCDYGGKYPVQDVIQSGVIGSLMLCAPNVNEGIKVPVCVSGVNAGLKALTSVSESYRDCLQESADTGKTVGICDEIHSIYMCEFLWKQAIPLAKIAAPAVLSKVVEGKTTKGGGEYFSIKDAWSNAQESIKYFTDSYAVQSYKAFKARSQDQVGTAVCKNFVSAVFPSDLGSLSVLTQSDNPPQFIASFEEIPYSTTTNPAMSQYKVYYHIYAGTDSGAYYSVYLRGTDSSYYEDAAVGRRVDSGYVESGGYASQTVDFLGPVGYTQLCVRINDEQEECGFGKVSTSFAVNYLSDAYIQAQAGQTDITTEEDCVSGTANLMSLLNLNAENALDNLIDPNIAAKGIIRICATSNPGKGSDVNYGDGNATNDQWLEVGYCGDKNMKCWIDTQSLKQAFNWEYSYNTTINTSLKDAYDNTVDEYLSKQGFWDEAKFSEFLANNLTDDLSPVQRIVKINSVFDYLYYNNHKAYLLLERAKAYGEIVVDSWTTFWKNKKLDENNQEEDGVGLVLDDVSVENYFNSAYSSPIFEFEDGVDNFISGGRNLFYKYSSSKWGVNRNNENINWVLASDSDFADKLNLWSAEKNNQFIPTLNNTNYLTGLDLLINRTLADKEAGFVSPDLVSKDSSDDAIVDLSSEGIFEIKNAGDFGSLYLMLKDKEWKWYYASIDSNSDKWLSLSQTVVKIQGESSTYLGNASGGVPIYSSGTAGVDITLSQNIIYLFSALEKKNFYEGAAIIFANTDAWEYFGRDVFYSNGLGVLLDLVKQFDTGQQFQDLFDELYQYGYITDEEYGSLNEALGISLSEARTQLKFILIPYGNISYDKLSILGGVSESSSLGDLECSNKEDCQKVIGNLILNYAKEAKKKYNINDSQIRNDTGYVSFECLVTAVALQESGLQFCDSIEKNNNPLYCENEETDILRGDSGNSYGALQVNKALHSSTEYGLNNEKFLTLRGNALFGANHLATLYSGLMTTYKNGKNYECSKSKDKYFGWAMAIRAYNGWNTDCTKGNGDYVEEVLAQRETLGKLFTEECGSLPAPSTGSNEVVVDDSKKEEILNNLIKDNWPIKRTLSFANNLSGKYSDSTLNSRFVFQLNSSGIITPKQYKEINGEGLFNLEENMDYVYNLLVDIAEAKTKKTISQIGESDLFISPSTSSSSTDSCERVEVLESAKALTDAQQRVIETVRQYRNSPRPSDLKDGCYSATQYIYAKAGTYTEGNCVYSDLDSNSYTIGDYTFTTGAKSGSVYAVNPSKCAVSDYDESDKLSILEEGYLISYYSGSGKSGVNSPHNAIFVQWINKANNQAMLFDWNGDGGTTYRYYSEDLSNSVHPVYMIWEPKIAA